MGAGGGAEFGRLRQAPQRIAGQPLAGGDQQVDDLVHRNIGGRRRLVPPPDQGVEVQRRGGEAGVGRAEFEIGAVHDPPFDHMADGDWADGDRRTRG